MSFLHLATSADKPMLMGLVRRYHDHENLGTTDEERSDALDTLFSGEVQAAIWLIGPRKAPVGYIAVSFGFSLELGGRDAFIHEFFIRESVRGRGMGSQVLTTIIPILRNLGIQAFHMEVDHNNTRARKLYERAGFQPRDQYYLMTQRL